MSEHVSFTEDEKKEIRQSMKNGGIFLKLFVDPGAYVEVQAPNGNFGWKTIKSFDSNISAKINALYNAQDVYKAPVEDGCRKVSLSWFIAEYC